MFTHLLKSIIIIGLFTIVSFAQTLSVQGVLRDPQGHTVDDDHYSLTLKLYEQEEGGNAIWQEIQTDVNIVHGVFSIELGSINPMDSISFTSTYYLGLTVGDDPEMSPRIKLLTAPSAMSMIGTHNVVPSLGNVGIGTTDPQANLHIVPYEADDDFIKVESSDSTGFKVDAVGDLYLEGGAVIKFADGTQLSSANFTEPATGLKSYVDVTLRTDANIAGDGNLNIYIEDSLQMVVGSEGVETSGIMIGGSYPGSMVMFAGSTAPEGWLLCDGSEYDVNEYSMLYDVIGTTYGSGTGTFKVPDMRGKGDMGYDADKVNFDEIGETGGEETHTLTAAEMPGHTHPVNPHNRATITHYSNHDHDIPHPAHDGITYDYAYLTPQYCGEISCGSTDESTGYGGDNNFVEVNHLDETTLGGSHDHTINFSNSYTNYSGSGNSYNILHSFITMNYIIKY